jgi:hypothetical protein
MRNYLAISLVLLIVLANGYIGHFYPPKGIDFTPIVLIIDSLLIVFGTKNLKAFWKSAFIVTFIILNDILIKLYSGGSHDNEGLEWIHFFLYLGLLPSFVILSINIIRDKNETKLSKIIAIIIFPILITIYLQFFYTLGLGRYYPI